MAVSLDFLAELWKKNLDSILYISHQDVYCRLFSLQTWLCGGSIEIALCSRVGHIFRNTRPYSSPTGEDTMTKNTLRMANVWLDDSLVCNYLLSVYLLTSQYNISSDTTSLILITYQVVEYELFMSFSHYYTTDMKTNIFLPQNMLHRIIQLPYEVYM